MSLDCLQPSNHPPLKRLRETISLATISNAKCGEIFVTSNWDKWSFNCTYCHMSTADIGVFVCHIRLQHLSAQDIPNVYETNNSSDHQQSLTCHNPPAHDTNDKDSLQATPKDCEIITKTESLAINEENLPPTIEVNSETTCTKVAKIINLETLKETQNKAEDGQDNNNENETTTTLSMDFVDIKPKLEPITLSSEEEDGPASRSLKNKPEIIEQEVRHIFYVNEAPENHSEDSLADEHVYSEDHFETHRFLSDSLTDDDEDLEENYRESDPTNDVNCETRRDPSPVLPSRRQNPENPSNCPASYKCKICNLQLKSKVFLIYHMKRIHNQKYEEPTMYTCRHCQKVFRSLNGLRNHLKTHNEKNFQQCPICQCKYLQNFYVNHVLTHESNTCLPCQVCGQIFKTPRERMKHWESHSKDFPYGCDYCYRRFRREQYLQNHLKIHCQYRCSYCGNEFGAGQPQKPPYICDSCQKKPEIRRKMEQKRSGGGGYLAKV